MIRREDCERSIRAGLDFLKRAQLPSGEFVTLSGPNADLIADAHYDPSNFTTMHVASSLLAIGSDEAWRLALRAGRHLFSQMLPGGLWRFWSNSHPGSPGMPPDTDDTACVAHLLKRLKFELPDSRPLLKANRNRNGLFYTWVLPRAPHLRHREGWMLAWLAFKNRKRMAVFFSSGRDVPLRSDVDAVVNANALLECNEPEVIHPVCKWLAEVFENGSAETSDRWYQSEVSLLYALMRIKEAGVEISDRLHRLAAARVDECVCEQRHALECGQLLSVACNFRPGTNLGLKCTAAILKTQAHDGSWPARAHYYGGKGRARAWGSNELTTGFCIEALARFLNADR
jgi:hypothetical protein